MSEMTLFKSSASTLALLRGLDDDLTNKIAGSGGNRRISIEGGVFREFIGGKEVRVSEERSMQIVVLNAAPVSRTYYAGTYVKGQKMKPTCWSADTQTPDPQVPAEQRQASRCADCKQNIKGSAAQGEGRACRFSQRLAVALVTPNGVDDNVYQISLPATSVFGDPEGQKMPLQAYGRYLKANNTHIVSVVTEMRFDVNGQMKLIFKPIRALEDDELRQVLELREHPDTQKAITFTVSQMDEGEKPAPVAVPVAMPKPTAKPAPKPVVHDAVEDVVEEPKKTSKKSSAPAVDPAPKADLADIVGDWDD
jgi:hypothetical protein